MYKLIIYDAWMLFVIALGVMLLATLIMSALGKHFYTQDVLLRKFTILDLEFAATGQEIKNIIDGIFALPMLQSAKVIKSLRWHIFIDFFLFMPAAYGSIFILCMKVSEKMGTFGQFFFPLLAWLQILAFVLDGIENIYLLSKLRHDVSMPSKAAHKRFQILELTKWSLALFATICSLSALAFFWVSGMYNTNSLSYLIVIAAEIALFFIINSLLPKTKQPA